MLFSPTHPTRPPPPHTPTHPTPPPTLRPSTKIEPLLLIALLRKRAPFQRLHLISLPAILSIWRSYHTWPIIIPFPPNNALLFSHLNTKNVEMYSYFYFDRPGWQLLKCKLFLSYVYLWLWIFLRTSSFQLRKPLSSLSVGGANGASMPKKVTSSSSSLKHVFSWNRKPPSQVWQICRKKEAELSQFCHNLLSFHHPAFCSPHPQHPFGNQLRITNSSSF